MHSSKLFLASSTLGLALLLPQWALADQKAPDQIKAGETKEEHCDSHKKADASKAAAKDKEECHTKHGKKEDCDQKDCETKHKKMAETPAGHQHGYTMPKLDSLLGSGVVKHLLAMSLSEDQNKQLEQVASELQQKNQPLLDQIGQTGKPLRELYMAHPRDVQAISQQYSQIFELQQKMINNVLEADNKAFALINDQQREHFVKHQKMMQKMHSGK